MRRSQKRKPTRREFLERSAQALGALTFGSALPLRTLHAAVDPATDYRLIHIEVPAGCDTFWSHNALLYSQITGFADAAAKSAAFKQRFSDSNAIAHPTGAAHPLGLLNHPSVISSELWSEILIWRGLDPAAGHRIGNDINNHGSPSSYAASYATLIAQDLAKKFGSRPLHFAQLGDRELIFSKQGLLRGAATPVNISKNISSWDTASNKWVVTKNDWNKITAPSGSELSPSRRASISRAIGKITQGVKSNFSIGESKTFYDVFNQSYIDGDGLLNSNYEQSPEFQGLVSVYRDHLTGVFTGLATSNPTLKAHLLKVAPLTLGNTDSWRRTIEINAFNFALTEFLITRNLSRVVELSAPNSDAHNQNDTQVAQLLISYAGFGKLLKNLRAAVVPNSGGKKFLDLTTVVLSSEFDRAGAFSAIDSASALAGRPGTDHGATASFLLAGRGVAGGKIVGEIKASPSGVADSRFGSGVSNRSFLYPLPINTETGEVSPTGEIVSTKCFFPTILALFGVPVPSNQVTDGHVIQAVLKKS